MPSTAGDPGASWVLGKHSTPGLSLIHRLFSPLSAFVGGGVEALSP